MDPFKRMEGAEVCLDWLNNDETAMREPIVVDTSDGLGMKMPPADLTVSDVAELVGPDMLVEVMGVSVGLSFGLLPLTLTRQTLQHSRTPPVILFRSGQTTTTLSLPHVTRYET